MREMRWGASPKEVESLEGLFNDLRIAEEYDNIMMIAQAKREIEKATVSIQLLNALN